MMNVANPHAARNAFAARPAAGRRVGLVKILIGSRHMVRTGGGKILGEFEVGDARRQPDASLAKTKARCLTCRKDYKGETELRADHDEEQLRKDESAHTWGFWSDETVKRSVVDAATTIGGAPAPREIEMPLGLLSDEAALR